MRPKTLAPARAGSTQTSMQADSHMHVAAPCGHYTHAAKKGRMRQSASQPSCLWARHTKARTLWS